MGSPLAEASTLAGWLGLGDFDADSPDEQRATTIIGVISDLARGEARQPTWELATAPANVSAIVLMVAVETWARVDGKTSVTVEEVTRRWEAGDIFSESQLFTLRSFRPGQTGGLSSIQFSRGMTTRNPITTSPVEGSGRPVGLYDGRGY